MIGASLSGCIADLLDREGQEVRVLDGWHSYPTSYGDPIWHAEFVTRTLELTQVDMIVCGTRIVSERDWDEVIHKYGEIYWQGRTQEAVILIDFLRKRGRITQPRLGIPERCPVGTNRWYMDESLIRFFHYEDRTYRLGSGEIIGKE
jgi:hypothetical protein